MVIVEFDFEFDFEFEFGVQRDGGRFSSAVYIRYSYVRLRCTSKAGVSFLYKPKERVADHGSDVCMC